MTAIETADRFMAGAKNLAEFTDEQLHGVVQSVLKLSPTDRENCILALYHRAYLDLKTITRVEGIRDLQSICRAARAMLEYAVDLRLTEIIPDATSKQLAFIDVEKLRLARHAVNLKKRYPEARLSVSVYEEFIVRHADRVAELQVRHWPDLKKVAHWSGMNTIVDRCRKLGAQYEQWYEVDFRRLSLHAHSGLLGFVDLPADAFNAAAALALSLIVHAYSEVVQVIIRQLKIDKASEKTEKLLQFAKMVSFSEDDTEARRLLREMIRS